MDRLENEELAQKEATLDREGFKDEGVDIISDAREQVQQPESLEEFSEGLKAVASNLEQKVSVTKPQSQQGTTYQPKNTPQPPQQRIAGSTAEEEGFIEVPGGDTFGGGSLESEIAQVLQDAESTPVKKEAVPINDPSIKPLRTYKTDTEEAIQNQRISVVNIAIAETKKKEEEEAKPETVAENSEPHNIPYGTLITSFLLLAVGAGAFYFVYVKKIAPVDKLIEVPKEEAVKSPVASSKALEIDFPSSKNLIDDFAIKGNELNGVTIGTLINIKPVIETTSGKTSPSAQTFFEKATPTIPGKLSRSLSKEFMLGIHVFDRATPFIVIKTTFFQNAFAGMLEWESTLPRELNPLITLSHGDSAGTGTFFIDTVIKNKDVRVFKAIDGKELLFYTFVDKNTILITTKRGTLEELITRLTTTTVVK
jgi:hypothetical protein